MGGRLSVYQLTIETGTPFARNGVNAASEETAEALFHLSNEVLDGAGLPAYEISNHARPGSACQHNLLYWRSGEHIGIGPAPMVDCVAETGAGRPTTASTHPADGWTALTPMGTARQRQCPSAIASALMR